MDPWGDWLRMTRGRPYVRVKLAMSVDGRTAMASGESQWITGPAARRDVQHWRAMSGAVITEKIFSWPGMGQLAFLVWTMETLALVVEFGLGRTHVAQCRRRRPVRADGDEPVGRRTG